MNRIQVAKVSKIRHLTDQAFVLRVERNGFEFVPGQCVNLGLPGGAVNREYSTYSAANEENYLEFLIRTVADGVVSPKLQELKAGDYVTLDGAYGLFVIPSSFPYDQKYVFVATGTGIAPFHSFALSFPNLDYQVLHGVRYAREQYDRQDYKQGRYLSCLSREAGGDFNGRVTDYLRGHLIDPKSFYYLCGNRAMINEVYDILRKSDVSGSNIFTEVFF